MILDPIRKKRCCRVEIRPFYIDFWALGSNNHSENRCQMPEMKNALADNCKGIKKAAGEIRTRVGHLGKVVRNHYATAACEFVYSIFVLFAQ